MQQEVGDRLLVRLGGVAGDRVRIQAVQVDVHARARLPEVHRQQREGEGHGGDQLEIDQRLQRHAADAAHVVHAGDAVHHRAEDHRRDDHPHQGDEGVAERLHLGAQPRLQPAQDRAQDHADQHLEPEPPDQAQQRWTRCGPHRLSPKSMATQAAVAAAVKFVRRGASKRGLGRRRRMKPSSPA